MIHEAKDLQVADTIALDGGVVLELEEANVPVMVLDGFLLKSSTLLRSQGEIWILTVSTGRCLLGAFAIEVEPRLVAHGLLAVGTAFHVHLEDSQINPQLDLLAVLALKSARHHLTRLVVPVLQHLGEVERHRPGNMETSSGRVNAQGR